MRLTYVPIRLLIIGFALVAIAVMFAFAIVHHGIMSSIRRLRWPREQARRARLPRVVAQVVKRVRVTKTHRQYVVRVIPPGPVYRAAANAMTFRTTLDLPPKARKQIRETGTIPLLFDAERPDELILDRSALPDLADERSEYIRLGTRKWTQLP